ncbi:MAG: rRNA large subunit methyltransferase I, partial [Clostridia bacterium]
MATAFLHKSKEQRVYDGHPWVFRSDIARVEGVYKDGDVVRVASDRGKFLAMAVYNPRSQISLRILSHQEEAINSA